MEPKFFKKVLCCSLMATMALNAAPSFTEAAAENFQVTAFTGSDHAETNRRVMTSMSETIGPVFVLNSEKYADALTGGILATEQGAIVVGVSETLDDETRALLQEAQSVTVIGGEDSIPDALLEGIEVKERIAGKDRYETAEKVAETLGGDRDILVASGENFADSMTATSLAVKEKRILLLTAGNHLPTATKDYLDRHGKKQDIDIVGGESSVSSEVKEEIKTLGEKSELDVLAGANRSETSLKIAERYDAIDTVAIASGNDFSDALSAGLLAAKNKAPLILVNGKAEQALVELLKTNPVGKLYAVSTGDNLPLGTLKEINGQVMGISSEESTIYDFEGKAIAELQAEEALPFTGWVTTTLNVRSGADTSYRAVAQLPRGFKVEGTLYNDAWVRFEYEGELRYCMREYLSTEEIVVEEPKVEVPAAAQQNQGPEGLNYAHSLVMQATAYTSDPAENGGWSVTALGTPLRRGVVAVDPSVIPLGTKLYIEGYGYATAEDTGGAIRGNRIDLLMDSYSECTNFGRRNVTVYILN